RERGFRNVLDLGCGTGLLAIGAAKLWKRRVLASDIDPVAVEVTRDNARANGVGPLVAAVTADGLTSPVLANAAPYDLLIANILAGPLTQLAPAIQKALAPGAVLLLSGLLNNQEKLVTSFYQNLRFVGTRRMGPWSALVLEKPAR
ncbi:MAG TPA: 50S ribosomal protein L11 methyltransferase, partial [Rhizomicrobium sp.]|nr:50S ribosomal protein L11 methyltransferase [Rhizomicrobium sp.]